MQIEQYIIVYLVKLFGLCAWHVIPIIMNKLPRLKQIWLKFKAQKAIFLMLKDVFLFSKIVNPVGLYM